jgi:uracil-DNA glycosylase
MNRSKTAPGAAPFIPPHATLSQLRQAVQACQGCDLYRNTTQAVFGEGSEAPRIVLVGEQPGDKEDLTGHPFCRTGWDAIE